MRSTPTSKSTVYAGDGAMDRRWRMSSTISRSRSEKVVEDAPDWGYSGASKELQPEDRVS
ncbi:hypothetical protein PDIG_52450 [Penicillium digitatum PHI26]|uniref:Uncharacterized protein n=2 Tax=Penicillium digitatum TaxID=36651 RepID=K9FNE7_PEND2|nr:hypothetical protein PDIP_21640 [Penicillium digitatum Pd1]EKV11145.1 hypothetical protein PDIG_52450 [Penicillium digitatum PHI26]EKV19851.1 hypothetical protein PDIP_21640 [Penicillium digitatum Pd1]